MDSHLHIYPEGNFFAFFSLVSCGGRLRRTQVGKPSGNPVSVSPVGAPSLGKACTRSDDLINLSRFCMDLLNGVSDATITGAVTGGGFLFLFGVIWTLIAIFKAAKGYLSSTDKSQQKIKFLRSSLLSFGSLLLFFSIFVAEEFTLANGGYWFHSEGFYDFLRFYVLCVTFYYAFTKHKEGRVEVAFLALALGVLFNPFLPLDLSGNMLTRILTGASLAFLAYREQ